MKNIAKKIYYSLAKPSLSRHHLFGLGFVFHTEKIYDEYIFNRLLAFCHEYESITGKRALCTIMPPVSLRVKKEMDKAGATEDNFIQNLKQLEMVADLGFHGHFWRTPHKSFEERNNQIRNSTYEPTDDASVTRQFQDQVNWFTAAGIENNKAYAAGWWFTHRIIMEMQAVGKFTYDFSFSKINWTSGTWGKEVMAQNQIAFGEPFELKLNTRNLTCVQTVMGLPTTVPQDIIRIFNSLVEQSNKTPLGMMTTHDYNLQGDNLALTIEQVKYLKMQKGIWFFSMEDLPALLATRKLKTITL